MRFLTDHDVYSATIQFLGGLGHDIVRASDLGLADADDEDLLAAALHNQRILVTRDRDFGNIVFIGGAHSGVVYLRIDPRDIAAVHAELEQVLSLYNEQELLASFVVIEPGRHRIRRLTP